MARLFDDAATETLTNDGAPVTAYPFVMACFFQTDTLALTTQTLMWLGDKDAAQEHVISIRGADDVLSARSKPPAAQAVSAAVVTANVWQHGCGLYVAADDRRIFLNGGNKGTDITSGTPTNINRIRLGAYGRIDADYLSGMMAEAAIWDLSVWPGATASDKADAFEKVVPSLAKGFSPLFYPLGLKAYWPLVRGLNDEVGGYNLTADGTIVVAHPNIIQPCGVL